MPVGGTTLYELMKCKLHSIVCIRWTQRHASIFCACPVRCSKNAKNSFQQSRNDILTEHGLHSLLRACPHVHVNMYMYMYDVNMYKNIPVQEHNMHDRVKRNLGHLKITI